MRRFPHHFLPLLMLLLMATTGLMQGCARQVLRTYPASEQEARYVLQVFERYRENMEIACTCCIDAEADAAISVDGWFSEHTGKLSGYLQAMEPGYVKFVAINPLGQPFYILVTNGKTFKSLNVFDRRAYMGSVHSELYQKYAPPGFKPEFIYYWLTGRLQPGKTEIVDVMHAGEQAAFWLQVKGADSNAESMLLFDPEDMVILRHVLRNEQGEHLVDIHYADHLELPRQKSTHDGNDPKTIPLPAVEAAKCRIPARITVISKAGAERIEVNLHAFLDNVHLSAADFHLDIPDDFDQLFVQ